MKIINQSYVINTFAYHSDIYDICEAYCSCYNTTVPWTFAEQCDFVEKHLRHGSPLEHSRLTVTFTTNIGIATELLRHRHTAFTQESTRYCNYTKDKFGNELTFIKNSAMEQNDMLYARWIADKKAEEEAYFDIITMGGRPEEARGVLSKDLKTTLKMTTNYREWRHIFKLRLAPSAHYQMRELLTPLYKQLSKELPCVFPAIQKTEELVAILEEE